MTSPSSQAGPDLPAPEPPVAIRSEGLGVQYSLKLTRKQTLRESMMRRAGIAWLSSTHKSIEEIATTILRDIRPDRLVY